MTAPPAYMQVTPSLILLVSLRLILHRLQRMLLQP